MIAHAPRFSPRAGRRRSGEGEDDAVEAERDRTDHAQDRARRRRASGRSVPPGSCAAETALDPEARAARGRNACEPEHEALTRPQRWLRGVVRRSTLLRRAPRSAGSAASASVPRTIEAQAGRLDDTAPLRSRGGWVVAEAARHEKGVRYHPVTFLHAHDLQAGTAPDSHARRAQDEQATVATSRDGSRGIDGFQQTERARARVRTRGCSPAPKAQRLPRATR